MTKKINREFKTLNDREHVLLRPAMYIGNPVLTKKEMWVYDQNKNKFEFREIEYVPALLKCCEEIIDNCLDVAIDTEFKTGNKIKVKVTDTSIEVIDNGTGIHVGPPATEDEQGRWCPELAWTQMRAGTSFKEKRKGPSANGVGSTCVNIFCKVFKGTTDDGNLQQTVTCTDNMSNISVSKPRKSTGKTGTSVYMEPDLARFGQETISEEHKTLVYQRLLNLAVSYPQIQFWFNDKKINSSMNKFASLFSDEALTVASENSFICVFPNPYDEFRQYSYVNGISMARGGSQIDYTINEIVQPIKNKLIKKYKTIRPGDIKQKMSVVVFLTDFDDPQFDAQTKESLTNSWSDISKHYGNKINFEEFAKKILKNEAIINPIVESFRIKEELKARQELKKVKKVKISADKYIPPTGEQNLLVLCEGQSALASISQCLGRNGIGYYALRGLPLNCYDSSIQKIASNQEVKDVFAILGLDIAHQDKEAEPKINFNKIVIGVDADCYAGNTLVLTDTGYKPIKELGPKDKVKSSDGKFHDIKAFIEKRTNRIVKIKIKNDFVLASEYQKFKVIREGQLVTIYAKDLKSTDSVLKEESIDLLKIDSVELIELDREEILYDITVDQTNDFISYLPNSNERVVLHNCDGSHLASMLIGWFKKFAPKLYDSGKICRLTTPVAIIKDKKTDKILDWFFNIDQFKKWESVNDASKVKVIYLKGLGSLDKEDLQFIIDKLGGYEELIETYRLDDESNQCIEDWLGSDSEPRKEYLRNYNFDINSI